MDGQLLFSPEETGQKLKMGRSPVYELIKTGELRSIKIGRSRRVSATAIEEFVRRVEGEPAA